jgi:hypothetical protein
LQPQCLKVGGAVVLECRVMGVPVPDLQWYKDGQPLLPDGWLRRIEDDPGSGICALTISLMKEEDVGDYSVVAANNFGSAESRAAVLPREAFQEWLESEQRAITSQKKRSMMAQVESSVQQPRSPAQTAFYRPKTERWLDQQNLAAAYEAEVEAQRWLLQDPSPSASPSPSQPQKGSPAVAPRIDVPLRSQRLAEGADVLLTANISGSPRPRVHWLRNGMPISPSRRFSFVYKGSRASLEIKMVFPEDAGKYFSFVSSNFLPA